MDNPCTTLSNIGSYTNWIADFSNSRCSRTVNNSYTASIVSTIGNWWDNNNNVWREDGYDEYGKKSIGTTTNGCLWQYSLRPLGERLTYLVNFTCKTYAYNYNCPSGGTLSGSTCTKIDTEYKAFSSF